MENNKFTLNQHIFSFFDAVDDAFSFVKHSARKKGVKLQPPNVPTNLIEYFSNMYGDKRRYI